MTEQRDLRWAYNITYPREDYLELRAPVTPQLGSLTEAKVLAAVAAVTTASLLITFGLPLLLQVVIKAAMSKVWAIFNTLQILTLMPLMAITLPGNVQMIYDEFDKIANLEFIPKDKIYEFIFGEPPAKVSNTQLKDLALEKAGIHKDNLLKSIFLVVVAFISMVLLIGLIIFINKKYFHTFHEKVKKVFISIKNKLMFNSVFRSALQMYLPLCISCFVSLKFADGA